MGCDHLWSRSWSILWPLWIRGARSRECGTGYSMNIVHPASKRNWVSVRKLLIPTCEKKLGYISELRTRVFLKYSFNRQIIQTQVERFTSIFPTIQTFRPWQICLNLKYETILKARFLLKSKISNNEKVKVWPQSSLLRNLVLRATTYYDNDEKFQSDLISYICIVRIEIDLHPYFGQ